MKPFLFFDAYGTLVELDDFFGRLQRGFALCGVPISDDDIHFAARREMAHYVKSAVRAHDEASFHDVRAECARVLGNALGERGYSLPDEARVLSILVEAIRFRAFPETRQLLEELQRREVPCAVVSNWDFKLPQYLEEIDLARFFRFILSSAEVGAAKPSPLVFEGALQRAREYSENLAPADCFYIGDDYENDVLGARSCGMQPFFLVRAHRAASLSEDAKTDPAPKIDSLLRVLDFLD